MTWDKLRRFEWTVIKQQRCRRQTKQFLNWSNTFYMIKLTGFGDNIRVLEWILGRADGIVPASGRPVGVIMKLWFSLPFWLFFFSWWCFLFYFLERCWMLIWQNIQRNKYNIAPLRWAGSHRRPRWTVMVLKKNYLTWASSFQGRKTPPAQWTIT